MSETIPDFVAVAVATQGTLPSSGTLQTRTPNVNAEDMASDELAQPPLSLLTFLLYIETAEAGSILNLKCLCCTVGIRQIVLVTRDYLDHVH